MIKTTVEYVRLTADDGMTLTNGKFFSKNVYLGCNDSPDNWREITDEEAEKLKEAEEE